MRYSSLRSRRGVSLLEMAIVIAIISVLAAIGAGMISKTLPRWRTREAAYEFGAAVSHARELATIEATEYRVAVTTFDMLPGDGTGGGAYLVQRGDAPANSSAWDTLPLDIDGVVDDSQGITDIGPGGKDELPGVGIRYNTNGGGVTVTTSSGWDTGGGGGGTGGGGGGGDTGGGGGGSSGDQYIISFGPSGMSTNPASDFGCDVNGDGVADGYLCVTFDNDRALAEGLAESYTVIVSRAGLVRVLAGASVDVGAPAGTATTSITTEGSSGSGYAFGGTGDPTGWGSGGEGGGGDTGGWGGGGDTGGFPM